MNQTNSKLSVLFCAEGTYPFEGGGVSVWCDILCRELTQARYREQRRDIEYTLLAVMGSPNMAPKFNVPANARKLIRVPLWGAQEPAEYILRNENQEPVWFSSIYQRKEQTTESIIEAEFVEPLLRKFLQSMQAANPNLDEFGRVIYQMWLYFQRYDWNITWKSQAAWNAFIEEILRPYEENPHHFLDSEIPSHLDLTTAMRWMYNFLMPLNVPIPPETGLIHSSIASFAGLAGVIAKFHEGIPFLVTEHGVSIRERYIAISSADFGFFAKQFLLTMSGLISRLIYHYADIIAPVANFNRRWEERYGAVDPTKIETIYNGIDPAVFTPKPKPEKTARRPTAVAAARIFPLKDIEMMIRSAAIARETIPNVYYLVYGSLNADPPYVEKCRRLIAELKLEGAFEFGGFHSKPAEIYTEGDISVLSSISEGFPFTVLESLSCARPVVGTDVGGVKEALEPRDDQNNIEDVFGIVTPPRDHEAFGRGVVKLLQDDHLRLEMGRKGRERVILKFQTAHMVQNYRRLYERLIAQDRVRPAIPATIPPKMRDAQPTVELATEYGLNPHA
jgi:glycosyltransferase involved in cell wall biosynthesis